MLKAHCSLPAESPQPPESQIDVPTIPSKWARVQDLRVHYKCIGSGAPVLLIHGSASDWHEWEENVLALAQGFRIYAVDMPGYGLSEPTGEPLTLGWAVSFLQAFMASAGIRKPHIVGHSLGGMVALALALDHPSKVAKLCLVDSAGLGDVSISGRLWLFLARRLSALTAPSSIPQVVSGLYDRMLPQRIRSLRAPTLIVWGARDRYLPVRHARAAHRAIRNSTLIVFPRSGHAPQREQPLEFNRLVQSFLDGAQEAGSPAN